MFTIESLQKQIAAGEDSTRQFKLDVRNADSLASEMAAFANSEGGTISSAWPMMVPFRAHSKDVAGSISLSAMRQVTW